MKKNHTMGKHELIAITGSGSVIGVFIWISTHDYSRIQSIFHDKTSIDTHSTTGTVLSIAGEANILAAAVDVSDEAALAGLLSKKHIRDRTHGAP